MGALGKEGLAKTGFYSGYRWVAVIAQPHWVKGAFLQLQQLGYIYQAVGWYGSRNKNTFAIVALHSQEARM